jgi:hypothetical protein
MDVCLNFAPERFLMKKRVFTAVTASLLLFSFAFGTFAAVDNKRPVKRATKARSNPLVAMLPASDAVVTINGKRFFGEALPKVLSANQKLLGEILTKLDNIQSKTGVDLRRFDSIVAGTNIITKAANDFDFDPVVIARGTVDAAALIESAKKTGEGKFKEETIAGRTVYLFSSREIAAQFKQIDPNSVPKNVELKNDVAVSMLDTTTIVFGSLNRVRETLEHKTSVNPEITALLGKKAPAIVNFAGKVPGGMSSLLPLDNDELGANINSIKHIYGSIDVVAGQATISITGRTLQAQQAADLKGTFEGLRDLGKAFLGAARSTDKQLYARLLTNVRITQIANEITLDLLIPQSDLDVLIGIVGK